MKNCLSNSQFENLLFVDVQIQGREATALFDTGAGMSVIAQSLLDALDGVQKSEALTRAITTAWFAHFRPLLFRACRSATCAWILSG